MEFFVHGGSGSLNQSNSGHATSTPPRDAWNFELCTSSAIIYPEVSASVYAQLLRPNGLRRTHHSFAVPWFRRMARVLRHKASGCDGFAYILDPVPNRQPTDRDGDQHTGNSAWYTEIQTWYTSTDLEGGGRPAGDRGCPRGHPSPLPGRAPCSPCLCQCGSRCGDTPAVGFGRGRSSVDADERLLVNNLQARHLGQDVVTPLLNVFEWQFHHGEHEARARLRSRHCRVEPSPVLQHTVLLPVRAHHVQVRQHDLRQCLPLCFVSCHRMSLVVRPRDGGGSKRSSE